MVRESVWQLAFDGETVAVVGQIRDRGALDAVLNALRAYQDLLVDRADAQPNEGRDDDG